MVNCDADIPVQLDSSCVDLVLRHGPCEGRMAKVCRFRLLRLLPFIRLFLCLLSGEKKCCFTCTICIARLPHLFLSIHFFGSTYDASALHKLT